MEALAGGAGDLRDLATKKSGSLPGCEYLYMSDHEKPQPEAQKPHMEKQTMDKPQEEFIGDEARPSKDVSEVAAERRGKVAE